MAAKLARVACGGQAVEKAKNKPLEVQLIFKLWDVIFTEPSRQTAPAGEASGASVPSMTT